MTLKDLLKKLTDLAARKFTGRVEIIFNQGGIKAANKTCDLKSD
jgi:ribosomal protein L1